MRSQIDPRNVERLSGRILYFPRLADGTYSPAGQSFGDIIMHKRTAAAETTKVKFHPPTGTSLIVREDTKSLETKFELTLQEHFLETDIIALFGTDGGVVTQASGTAATKTMTVAKRGIYLLGKINLSNVTATVSAAAKIVGTRDAEGTITPANADLIVDLAVGTVEIVEGGTIADAASLTVTFDHALVTQRSTKANVQFKRDGRFLLTEYDGVTIPYRRQHSFDGALAVTDQGDANQDSDGNQFKFEIAVSGDFTVLTTE